MVELVCVKFGDTSCIGFELSCGQTDRQTDRQTAVKNQTHAAAASMGNNMAKISTQMLERV